MSNVALEQRFLDRIQQLLLALPYDLEVMIEISGRGRAR